ncbi:hypothetical protein ACFQ7F_41860 [Streptomyces sp. NPDC056486]|uniref:hypothetical protein n=1 Tax=Streptomyces sp. NPDC056486 TaxID=3345835 RepID=UPI0036C683A2
MSIKADDPPRPLTRAGRAALDQINIENAAAASAEDIKNQRAAAKQQRKAAKQQARIDRRTMKRAAKQKDTREKQKAADSRAARWRGKLRQRRAFAITALAFTVSLAASVPMQIGYFTDLQHHGDTLGWIGWAIAAVLETVAWVAIIHQLDAADSGKPIGKYRLAAFLLATVVAAINYGHGSEQYGTLAGAALAVAAYAGVGSVESFIHLKKQQRDSRPAEQIRAAVHFRLAHPLLALRAWRLRVLWNGEIGVEQSRAIVWEQRHGAALGITHRVVKRIREQEGKVRTESAKLLEARYGRSFDAAADEALALDADDAEAPTLIVPGAVGHDGPVGLVDVLGRPLETREFPFPAGKKRPRPTPRRTTSAGKTEEEWASLVEAGAEALPKLEAQAERDRRLISSTTGTVSPNRLAAAVGLRADLGSELLDRIGAHTGRAPRKFERVNGHSVR